jgi:hypothetical protein
MGEEDAFGSLDLGLGPCRKFRPDKMRWVQLAGLKSFLAKQAEQDHGRILIWK